MKLSGAIVVVALSLLAVGCTAEPPPAKREPTKTSTPPTTRPPEPVEYTQEPLWSRPGIKDAGYTFVGDSLVHVARAPGENVHETLTVIDLVSGTDRWSIKENTTIDTDGARLDVLLRRPPVLDADGDWTLLVQYEKDVTLPSGAAGREQGFAALSGVDGRVRWRFPTLTGGAFSGPPTEEPRASSTYFAANDEIAVVNVADLSPGNMPDKLVAFNLATREKIWEAPGITYQYYLSAETVIGMIEDPEEDPNKAKKNTVVALDIRTGQKRWDTAELDQTADNFGRTGPHILLAVDPDMTGTRLVVDPETGATIEDLSTSDKHSSCATGDLLYVCASRDETRIYDPVTKKSDDIDPLTDGYKIRQIWQDRIIMTTHDEAESLILDRTGNPLVTGIDGEITAINDKHMVTMSAPDPVTDDTQFSLYPTPS